MSGLVGRVICDWGTFDSAVVWARGEGATGIRAAFVEPTQALWIGCFVQAAARAVGVASKRLIRTRL